LSTTVVEHAAPCRDGASSTGSGLLVALLLARNKKEGARRPCSGAEQRFQLQKERQAARRPSSGAEQQARAAGCSPPFFWQEKKKRVLVALHEEPDDRSSGAERVHKAEPRLLLSPRACRLAAVPCGTYLAAAEERLLRAKAQVESSPSESPTPIGLVSPA